jgi:O-antigen ligase
VFVALVAGNIGGLILLQGGEALEIALPFAFAQCATLLAWLSYERAVADDVVRMRSLRPAYVLFGLVILWGAAQVSVSGLGMASDAWRAVGSRPVITLDKFATLAEVAKLIGLGAVFMLGLAIGARRARAALCWRWLAWAGAAYLAWGLFDYVVHPPKPDNFNTVRLVASLKSSNTTAALAGLIAILAWSQFLLRLKAVIGAASAFWTRNSVRALGLPLSLVAAALAVVALTGSRGGALCSFLGLAVSVVLVFAAAERRRGDWRAAVVALVGLCLVCLLILFSVGTVADKMRFAAEGVSDRQSILALYLDRLAHWPWTGFGLGTFRHFNDIIAASTDAFRLWGFGAMHNLYLQWLYEGGAPGAILMFACLGWILWVTAICTARQGPSLWRVVSLSASALIMSHGLVDYDLQIPGLAAIWALYLGAGAADLTSQSPKGQDSPS